MNYMRAGVRKWLSHIFREETEKLEEMDQNLFVVGRTTFSAEDKTIHVVTPKVTILVACSCSCTLRTFSLSAADCCRSLFEHWSGCQGAVRGGLLYSENAE